MAVVVLHAAAIALRHVARALTVIVVRRVAVIARPHAVRVPALANASLGRIAAAAAKHAPPAVIVREAVAPVLMAPVLRAMPRARTKTQPAPHDPCARVISNVVASPRATRGEEAVRRFGGRRQAGFDQAELC